MAKVRENPKRLPCPLSFVDGEAFVLCLTAGQVRTIRDRYPEDDKGSLLRPDLYLEGLCEATVVGEDGTPLFAEGDVGRLFETWQREAVRVVADVYTPVQKKDSGTATTSQESSPSTPAAVP